MSENIYTYQTVLVDGAEYPMFRNMHEAQEELEAAIKEMIQASEYSDLTINMGAILNEAPLKYVSDISADTITTTDGDTLPRDYYATYVIDLTDEHELSDLISKHDNVPVRLHWELVDQDIPVDTALVTKPYEHDDAVVEVSNPDSMEHTDAWKCSIQRQIDGQWEDAGISTIAITATGEAPTQETADEIEESLIWGNNLWNEELESSGTGPAARPWIKENGTQDREQHAPSLDAKAQQVKESANRTSPDTSRDSQTQAR